MSYYDPDVIAERQDILKLVACAVFGGLLGFVTLIATVMGMFG